MQHMWVPSQQIFSNVLLNGSVYPVRIYPAVNSSSNSCSSFCSSLLLAHFADFVLPDARWDRERSAGTDYLRIPAVNS